MNILYEYMTFLSGRQREKKALDLLFCIFSVFFILFFWEEGFFARYGGAGKSAAFPVRSFQAVRRML